MNGLLLPDRQVFVVDTHVNYDPTAEQLAEITIMAAEEMMRFGIKPKAALLSHSNFGSSNQPSAVKMRQTLDLLRVQAPWLEVDGEMHGDVALVARPAWPSMPNCTLVADANLLVMPNIDVANISYNLVEDRRWRQYRDRPGAAGRGRAGAHSHRQRHGAPHRQHDRPHRGGCQRGPITAMTRRPLNQWALHPPLFLPIFWAGACLMCAFPVNTSGIEISG